MNNCFVTLILIKTNKFCTITRVVKLCSQLSVSGILSMVVILSPMISDHHFHEGPQFR